MALIENVTLHRRSVPLLRPFVTAVRATTSVDALIVEVSDTDGRSGWGEAPTSWRVTGESPASVTAAVEGPLRDAMLGLSADVPAATSDVLSRAVVRNSAARMAVDCALYDLAAQLVGVPLYRYLGGSVSEIRTDMTLSAVTSTDGVPAMIAMAREHKLAGFRTLKVKLGAGGDDVAVMRSVRNAVGDDVVLRADANQGWAPQQAVSVIRAWEDAGLNIQLIEQPVHMDDLDALAFVTDHVDTPVLADESVWTARDAREVLSRHAADMINIKLAKTGGIHEALAVLDLAVHAGVGVIVGCMMESQVGIGAAAALASAVQAAVSITDCAHDLDAGLWLAESPILGGASYDRDVVRLSDGLGLGIAGLTATTR